MLWFAVGVAGATARAETGPPDDLVAGIDAYNGGDYGTAAHRLQSASDQGNAEAMVNLGYLYARGQGVVSNPDYALLLYQRAAALGDAEGMNAIGYRLNFATPPDLHAAIEWYCRALALGNPRAMNNLALLVYNGRGVPPDRAEARNLWRQSSALGHLNARANLGLDLASDATLPEQQRQQGYAMLRDAALRGSAVAQDILRRSGDTEAFPPPTVTALTMRLEPRGVPPGSSNLCGRPIS
jgi:TPR repeat protein